MSTPLDQLMTQYATRFEALLRRFDDFKGSVPADLAKRAQCLAAVELFGSAFMLTDSILNVGDPARFSSLLDSQRMSANANIRVTLSTYGLISKVSNRIPDQMWFEACAPVFDSILEGANKMLDLAQQMIDANQ